MFTKIYENIKEFMKENYVFLIILFVIIVFFNIHLPYEVDMPGGTIDLGNRILVNGEETSISGSFNMAYVSVAKGNIPYLLLAFILPDWDIVSESETKYENETIEQANERDKLYLEQSKDYATAVGMTAANIPYEVTNKVNSVVYIDPKAHTDLQVGDNIKSVNGKIIEDINEISAIVQETDEGSQIEIVVLRDNKEITTTSTVYREQDKKYIGVSSITTFDINSDTKVEITSKTTESGPSGGLMMSLMVYNALTKQDLTHGKKIVGTGTISLNGQVGEIGGVKYKLMGAVKDHADIFLVPEGNYQEALEVKKDKKYDIDIVSVKTINDAITYLEGLS